MKNRPSARDDDASPLNVWLRVFAPEYRPYICALAAFNILSAIATFTNLQLLGLFVRTITADNCTDGLYGYFKGSTGVGCGAQLSLFIVALIGTSLLLKGWFDLLGNNLGARLDQKSKHAIEREVLRNLMKQDDDFYVRRSPSEVINRLSGDLQRVSGRRRTLTQIISNGFSIAAITWVLFEQSWIAAVVGVVVSAFGVVASQLFVGDMQRVENDAMVSDDRLKASFEDTLQGVPEIQVRNLLKSVIRDFERRQDGRDGLALKYSSLTHRAILSQQLAFALGFVGVMLAAISFSQLEGDHRTVINASLIVVLTSALPQLYFNFMEVARLLIDFQIAKSSVGRLEQYQAPPAAGGGFTRQVEELPGKAVALRNVHYQFQEDGVVRGGPEGINCEIPDRGLTGIIGAAGSGKSTLVRLLLGRLRPVGGEILYGDIAGTGGQGTRFAFLPQHPILFDTTMGDNLFFAEPDSRAATLDRRGDLLSQIGLFDLVRHKGLDGHPEVARSGPQVDIAQWRDRLDKLVNERLRIQLVALAAGAAATRQLVIENQLGSAIDQELFAARLGTRENKSLLRNLARTDRGEPLCVLARSLLRQSAPLLEKTTNSDAYNGIASVAVSPAVWQLRRNMLHFIDAPSRSGHHDIALMGDLCAVALSAKVEEVDKSLLAAIPTASPSASDQLLAQLVVDVALPFDPSQLNRYLTWRENLLFAEPDRVNSSRVSQIDEVVLEALRDSPLDRLLVEAGLDYRVGRHGGRLSGGQRQLVALGRTLVSAAPIVVLDEPTSAFHPQLRSRVVAALRIEATGRSIVVITHDIDMAKACDQLIFVKDGAITGQAPWEQLLAHDASFREWVAAEGGAAQ